MSRIVTRAAGTVLSMAALLFVAGTSQATATTHQADAARIAAARQVDAEGAFTASVDFPSLVPRDVGMSKCEFRVPGTLTFTGTLAGVASGTTTALIDAPCSEALSNPPGTFRDMFRFEGRFDGTVAGVPAEGDLSYAGVTRPGGSIDANIHLRAGDVMATLRTVDAELGRGGRYGGVAVIKG
jgi:hypothetical protein